MATLKDLQPIIDNGSIAERNANISTGYSIKHLVYKEEGKYVFAEFDTRYEKAGAEGFDTIEALSEKVRIITPDEEHWSQIKKEVPFESGNKFFYLWLANWCEQWRNEKIESPS